MNKEKTNLGDMTMKTINAHFSVDTPISKDRTITVDDSFDGYTEHLNSLAYSRLRDNNITYTYNSKQLGLLQIIIELDELFSYRTSEACINIRIIVNDDTNDDISEDFIYKAFEEDIDLLNSIVEKGSEYIDIINKELADIYYPSETGGYLIWDHHSLFIQVDIKDPRRYNPKWVPIQLDKNIEQKEILEYLEVE